MKVKEFLEDLQKCDPEAEIYLPKWYHSDMGSHEDYEEPELLVKDGSVEIR